MGKGHFLVGILQYFKSTFPEARGDSPSGWVGRGRQKGPCTFPRMLWARTTVQDRPSPLGFGALAQGQRSRSGLKRPVLKSCFYHLLAAWPWASDTTSLGLSFFICEMGLITIFMP